MAGATAVVFLVASTVLLLACGPKRRSPPDKIAQAPSFRLTDQNGRPFISESLHGKVWIANFVFTSCPDICPVMTSQMAGLQKELRGAPGVHFVSFSVDPEVDTPARLRKYAGEHSLDLHNWTFLTGSMSEVEPVIVQGFMQALGRPGGEVRTIAHSDRFVLVDRDATIRGFYPTSDLDELKADLGVLLR